ncbi:XdhC family protein [Pantoea sp. BAV 3049]|uniref:XdhC family protein n=1 Tax=Pantoea sp. BAV 3049 TaxID=2654188 RepID=UPI00131E1724|nr:XdhC family protein [Pantoea sp. BAV 3049]
MSLFTTASRLENENRAFALLQIIECRGSSPRHSASMLVPEEGPTVGTIGGGMMERLAIEQAREALAEGTSRVFHGKLARQGANAVGSDCGGAMTVHIAVYPGSPHLFLLGAGHVNRALARLAIPLGFKTTLADPWEENLQHPELPEQCVRAGGENFTAIISQLKLTSSSYVVIATNHQDREVLEQVISLPLAYLGLLASRRKAQHFRDLLQKEQGISADRLATLHAPVGLEIEAETPEEIAVSILAEMILHYRQKKAGAGQENKTQTGDVAAENVASREATAV